MKNIHKDMVVINSNDKDLLKKCNKSIRQTGFCLVTDVIDDKNCTLGIQALKHSYQKVINLIGTERPERFAEVGIIRAPMSFEYFFTLLENEKIKKMSELFVAETSILHLQNGFIFPPHNLKSESESESESKSVSSNPQYNFHKDFPRYMNGYVASINVLVTFTDITNKDEIFYVVPNTHHSKNEISQEYCNKNKISITAKAGSILVFDSTLLHCGGPNRSADNWYGVNHQFTRSFIKQQIDYTRLLGKELILQQKPRIQQMLGYYTRVITSLDEYYQPTEKRLYRAKQG